MSRSFGLILLLLGVAGPRALIAQEPAKPADPPKVEAGAIPQPVQPGGVPAIKVLPKPDDIKPLPEVPIPVDPPPHEGAMFDLPLTIDPPDVIDIELLEALPGRPITGDHLVMPDGTISLGFYGKVHVRGLTPEQAKVKIILHLRSMIADHMLGISVLKDFDPDDQIMDGKMPPVPPPATSPFNLELKPPDVIIPEVKSPPQRVVPPNAAEEVLPPPAAARSSGKVFDRSNSERKPLKAPERVSRGPEPVPAQPAPTVPEAPNDPDSVLIDPVLSRRVFVEITSFNSKVYYVQGDVAVPGRLPYTGLDTVLDALNYSGGLLPGADTDKIHLYRPARGTQPARHYKIDYEGIMMANAAANLQLFPGDRLVVGKDVNGRKNQRVQTISHQEPTTARSDGTKHD